MQLANSATLPLSKESSSQIALPLAMALSFGIMLASSKIYFNLPFTPVPVTFGPLGPIVCGLLFGRKQAVMGVLSYLLIGLLGVPVFAFPEAGISVFMGATAGYLLGYSVEAYVSSFLFERFKPRSMLSTFSVTLCSVFSLYACGLVGLSFFVPFNKLFLCGVAPFIFGDLAKCALASGAYRFFKKA
jgi:biotin transport system substrate-specific component